MAAYEISVSGDTVPAVALYALGADGAMRPIIMDKDTGVLKLQLTSDSTISIADISNGEKETVAASATDQVLGGTGAIADWLQRLIIIPASVSPGAVSIKDGAGSAIVVFAGGTNSLLELRPIVVDVMAKSTAGAWKVTTGANVSVIAIGNFT